MAPEDNIMTNRWQDLYFYKGKKKKNIESVSVQNRIITEPGFSQKCIPIYGFGIYDLILDEQDI